MRITAQFIDALKGHHVWSERYDRDLKDLFAIEDDITKNIITALQVMLTQGEQASLRGKGTENLDAYLKCMEAREYYLSLEQRRQPYGQTEGRGGDCTGPQLFKRTCHSGESPYDGCYL